MLVWIIGTDAHVLGHPKPILRTRRVDLQIHGLSLISIDSSHRLLASSTIIFERTSSTRNNRLFSTVYAGKASKSGQVGDRPRRSTAAVMLAARSRQTIDYERFRSGVPT